MSLIVDANSRSLLLLLSMKLQFGIVMTIRQLSISICFAGACAIGNLCTSLPAI